MKLVALEGLAKRLERTGAIRSWRSEDGSYGPGTGSIDLDVGPYQVSIEVSPHPVVRILVHGFVFEEIRDADVEEFLDALPHDRISLHHRAGVWGTRFLSSSALRVRGKDAVWDSDGYSPRRAAAWMRHIRGKSLKR